MSRTYRQSSLASVRNSLERDPAQPAVRPPGALAAADAETIRDNALAVSGLLVDRLGGKSQPALSAATATTPT